VQFGQIDELRALLDGTPELFDQADGRGMTALMAAAQGGHAAVVTELLERGADVTRRDDHWVSALEYAIREDRQELA
jgi:ankyrin repeat protein